MIAASKICKNILPASDPDLLTGLSHLSLVYFKQQKLEKAEEISKHILAARELAHSSDHTDTKRAKNNLALIQAEMLKKA